MAENFDTTSTSDVDSNNNVIVPIENTTENNADVPYDKRRVFTVILGADDNLQIQVVEEVFQGIPPLIVADTLAQILNVTSEKEAERALHEEQSGENNLTFTNDGGLYDDVVFESTVYIDNQESILIKTTFGGSCRNDIPVYQPLNMVANALKTLSDKFVNDANEMRAQGINENDFLEQNNIINENSNDFSEVTPPSMENEAFNRASNRF